MHRDILFSVEETPFSKYSALNPARQILLNKAKARSPPLRRQARVPGSIPNRRTIKVWRTSIFDIGWLIGWSFLGLITSKTSKQVWPFPGGWPACRQTKLQNASCGYDHPRQLLLSRITDDSGSLLELHWQDKSASVTRPVNKKSNQ